MPPKGRRARGSPSRERVSRPGSPGRGGRGRGSPGRYSPGRGSPGRYSPGRGSPSRRARRRPPSRPPTPPRAPPPLPPPPPVSENTKIIREIMARKMDEWDRMASGNRDVRQRSYENFRKLVDEEVEMANKIYSKRRLKELMELKLEYFDRLASEANAMLRREAESKFKEIAEREMALAKSIGPSRARDEADAEARLAEEREQKKKDQEARKAEEEKRRSKEEDMTERYPYGYPPWMRLYRGMRGAMPGLMPGFPFSSRYGMNQRPGSISGHWPAMRRSSSKQLSYGAPATAMQGAEPWEAQPSSSFTDYMGSDQAPFPIDDLEWLSMAGGGPNFLPPSSLYARNVRGEPVIKSREAATASEIDKKIRLLTQLEAARDVLQNQQIEPSASMAEEIRKRLKKINRLQMKVIDDVLVGNPDLTTDIVSELMPTKFERNKFYRLGSDSGGRSRTKARTTIELDLSGSERGASGGESMIGPPDGYNIGSHYLLPQELPPHTHYQEFDDFYPANVPHYHEQPPVFPAPTYSVLEVHHHTGHQHLPLDLDVMEGDMTGSLDDAYCDDQPGVLTPISQPRFLSQTTIIVNRRDQAVETDAVAQPSQQVLVQPVQQASGVAVPLPAQQTVVTQGSVVPLAPTQATFPSPPANVQVGGVRETPDLFADEEFVRECERNLARIAESVENMLHSLSTVSFDRSRGRRQRRRHHFDEDYYDDDYYDEGDDYDDYLDYRKKASKSRPSERRRRHTKDKSGPSLWNWLCESARNLRDRVPFPTNHHDPQLVQVENEIRELTRKINEASAEVIVARKAIQKPGLQGQQAVQALMTAESKLWALINLETQLANEIARYRILNTSSDQPFHNSLVAAEDKIRRLIQAETELAGQMAGWRDLALQKAGPTKEETRGTTNDTTSPSSSTSSSPTSGT